MATIHYGSSRLAAAFVGFCVLGWAAIAQADPCDARFTEGAFACVMSILESDADGRWADTQTTFNVTVQRQGGADPGPVAVGSSIAAGDLVVTRRARVELRLQDGGTVRISHGTELRVGSTFDQLVGNVWYLLRSMTTVRFGTVTAVVEGTEFWVTSFNHENAEVKVAEGTVLVRLDEEQKRVREDQRVRVEDGILGKLEAWSGEEQYELSRTLWRAGHPTLVIGLALGLGTAGRFFTPHLRGDSQLRIGGRMGISADVSATTWNDGWRLVVTAGPRYFLSDLPPPDDFDDLTFLLHHGSVGVDLVRVYYPGSSSATPVWGGAFSYGYTFPFWRTAVLSQLRLGVVEGPEVFWHYSVGVGLTL